MAVLKITEAARRRQERRSQVWPQAEKEIWSRKSETGFCTIPRTLGLIATLIRHLSTRTDPSRVYLDLWTRQFDDGFVEVRDIEEMAASAGYASPPRNVRTWRQAVEKLEDLGFIRLAPKGTRRHGYILLLHPHDVVEHLQRTKPGLIPQWWLDLFHDRVMEIGATLRGKASGKHGEGAVGPTEG